MIATERLLLRNWERRDREPFARLNFDARVMEFLPARLSRAESDFMVDRIESHFGKYGLGLYALDLREERTFIGFVGLSIPAFQAHFTPCGEIGWRLSAEYWGRGLATEAADAVERFAFESLALDALVSFTVSANIRSRRVMEKIGMTHDPADDFDHPQLPEGHPLRRHVLYHVRRDRTVIGDGESIGFRFPCPDFQGISGRMLYLSIDPPMKPLKPRNMRSPA